MICSGVVRISVQSSGFPLKTTDLCPTGEHEVELLFKNSLITNIGLIFSECAGAVCPLQNNLCIFSETQVDLFDERGRWRVCAGSVYGPDGPAELGLFFIMRQSCVESGTERGCSSQS